MFERKRKQLMICIIFAVMLGGFVLFRYLPLKIRTKALQIQRQQVHQTISQASIHSEALPALTEQLTKLRRSIANYDEQIPRTRNLGGFLQQIASLMNEHKLKEQMIEPQIEIELEQFNAIPVSLKCKGKLSQIFNFYKSLQDLNRFVRIEDFRLVNEKNFSGDIRMQTKTIIFYRPKAGQG